MWKQRVIKEVLKRLLYMLTLYRTYIRPLTFSEFLVGAGERA
jgi:hypothetical protein